MIRIVDMLWLLYNVFILLEKGVIGFFLGVIKCCIWLLWIMKFVVDVFLLMSNNDVCDFKVFMIFVVWDVLLFVFLVEKCVVFFLFGKWLINGWILIFWIFFLFLVWIFIVFWFVIIYFLLLLVIWLYIFCFNVLSNVDLLW